MLTKQKISRFAIEKILNNFDLGKIISIKPLATSGNITYIIKSDKNKYLLRLSPEGFRWRSKGEIRSEIQLIKHLLKYKFPVSLIISSKDDKEVIKSENRFGYIRKFIEGRPKLNPNLKEIEKFGEYLGWFHNLVSGYRTKNKRKHIWDLRETKKNFKEAKIIILKSKFKNKSEFVRKLESNFSAITFPKNLSSGMIHEDLGKRHVLWKKNAIVGIIDFDRSYYGSLLLDLGQACRGWCFTNNWRKWSNKNFLALIKGYQKKRKLTKLEKKYLLSAIKFGILERSLSFCLRFIDVSHDKEDEKYSLYSVSLRGLLGMVEENKNEIEKIIAASSVSGKTRR